jgi:L-amino acid N-acyltransferase YncA
MQSVSSEVASSRGGGRVAKAFCFLRYEGVGAAWRAFLGRTAGRLYSTDTVSTYLYRHEDARPLCQARVEAEVVELDASQLPRVDRMMYHPTESLRRRLQEGQRCFAVLVAGAPCGYLWVEPGPRSGSAHTPELRADQAYLYNVRTMRNLRGKGLVPHLYSVVCSRLAQEGVTEAIIWVDAGNRPSIRAAERAGFEFVSTTRRYHRFGRTWTEPLSGPPDAAA